MQPKRYRCVSSNDQATEEDTAKDRQVVSHIECHDRQHAIRSSAHKSLEIKVSDLLTVGIRRQQ